ncbi:DNA primase [Trueperella bialowiezensis]|uniref:DNA primase n=1 Tax=Trueperella bialowiezensis TaxID=312285 RepID=A0A3S4VS71_9ACTO|nr:DNA primase [Trueperella bialowiezensis]VEI12579.1 DNA primase [Trueperella bialowiezensis]
MAGLIKKQSIDEVRDRTRIDDVVSQYVTLKPAGVGSLKGLCPFHDEKTPSFNVRPHVGRWHCFGCGEGGDVISFIMNIEHISFVEAVEYLAEKTGVQLQYEEGSRPAGGGQKDVTRSRLIDAHRVAEEFYVRQLATPEAKEARAMLADRGFDADAIAHFRVGYAPDTWDSVLKELRRSGFTEKEISASGLGTQGSRGLYDRFRGRVMWPIRSITGDTIGFGARKLGDGDGPKYLNTPETMIYKKSQVLYGLDLAKRDIARDRRIVVVEGYTDVMAAHLAGVPHAVATCGTAFGEEHVKIVRRLLRDTANPAAGVMLAGGKAFGGEVIFTFDGDEAGKKAALRAFQEDQSFAAQTFVAISPGGLDPCDVRLAYGDEGVRSLVESRQPLFAFVIKSILEGVPLHTAEGRTAGLRAAAPVIASIRDRVLRGEYVRELAGWLGMDERMVYQTVAQSARVPQQIEWADGTPVEETRPASPLPPRNQIKDPVARVERQALEVMLQLPGLALAANAQDLPAQSFTVPTHQAVHDAIRAAGGVALYKQRLDQLKEAGHSDDLEAKATSWFVEQVLAQADDLVAQAITQLAVEPLPESDPDQQWPYVRGIMMSLIKQGITRQIADVRGMVQRATPDSPEQAKLFERLLELENQRRLFDETDT